MNGDSRTQRTAASIVIVLCLPLFLTAAALRTEISEPRLYYWSINSFKVPAVTGINQSELELACRQLIDYFNGDADTPQMYVSKRGTATPLFNERELIHLKDVGDLIRLDYRIEEITAILIAGCLSILALTSSHPRETIGAALSWGSGLTLALAGVLAVTVVVGFDQLFWQFHVISFSNLTWQLDPARDHLIQMFPQPFWNAAALVAIGLVIAAASGLMVLGRRLMK